MRIFGSHAHAPPHIRHYAYEGRGTAAKTVKESHELGHLNHLRTRSHKAAYECTDENSHVDSPNGQYAAKEDGCHHADEHSKSGEQVACHCGFDLAHHRDTANDGEREQNAQNNLNSSYAHERGFFLLNIRSIRWVIPKPPKTLTAAKTIASIPKI